MSRLTELRKKQQFLHDEHTRIWQEIGNLLSELPRYEKAEGKAKLEKLLQESIRVNQELRRVTSMKHEEVMRELQTKILAAM